MLERLGFVVKKKLGDADDHAGFGLEMKRPSYEVSCRWLPCTGESGVHDMTKNSFFGVGVLQ